MIGFSAFLLMTLFFLLVSISWTRIYFRTGLTGALLSGVGGIIGTLGVPGFFFWFDNGPAGLPSLPLICFVLMIVSLLFNIVAFPVMYIKESSAWKEIRDKTSYWQMLTGNVPTVKYNELPSPIAKKRVPLLLGILMMTGGSVALVFIKIRSNYFSAGAMIWFAIGMLYFIFSIVYLRREKERK